MDNLIWAALIALNVTMMISIYRSWGNYQYSLGRLHGFEEGIELAKEQLKKIMDLAEEKEAEMLKTKEND